MTRRSIAFVVMALWLVAMVPVAQADTGDIIEPQLEKPNKANDGWQAGTCTNDEITEQCTPESPISQFFRTAAGHSPIGFTSTARMSPSPRSRSAATRWPPMNPPAPATRYLVTTPPELRTTWWCGCGCER